MRQTTVEEEGGQVYVMNMSGVVFTRQRGQSLGVHMCIIVIAITYIHTPSVLIISLKQWNVPWYLITLPPVPCV